MAIVKKASSSTPSTSEGSHHLDYIFRPRSIAVVGASANPNRWANNFIRLCGEFGFEGQVYPVNPRLEELLGFPVYPSIRDIPGPVDHVVSCVPASSTAEIIDDCIAKKVKVIHIYSGRFGESGQPERIELEKQVVSKAKAHGIRIIGPNCVGIYVPREGISFKANFPKTPGQVAFISQSGGNCADFVYRSGLRGLRFSKVISYGNATDLNEADFLDYLAHDPETQIITAYIEGAKDGKRLLATLRNVSGKKPVAIYKGGITPSGRRAVASHTASLAGGDTAWDALFKQTKTMRADSLDELADIALTFQFLKPPTGRRIVAGGGGGGGSVAMADECEKAGLIVPPMPQAIREELKSSAPNTWSMISNPVDPSAIEDNQIFNRVLKLLSQHSDFDLILADGGTEWTLEREQAVGRFLDEVEKLIAVGKESSKPMAVVLRPGDTPQEWRWRAIMDARQRFLDAGFPVFPSVNRAARALVRFLDYNEVA